MQRHGAEHPDPEQRSPRRGFYGGRGSTTACSMGPAQPPPVQGEMLLGHSRVHGGTLSGTYVHVCKEPA